ncbi:hypothetical protein V8F33_009812 [Rhypophila sp. PSN 637]
MGDYGGETDQQQRLLKETNVDSGENISTPSRAGDTSTSLATSFIQATYRYFTKIAVAIITVFLFLFPIHDRGGDQIADSEIAGSENSRVVTIIETATSIVQASPTPMLTPIKADNKPEVEIMVCKYCNKLFVKSPDGHPGNRCGYYHPDNQTYRAANNMTDNRTNTKKGAKAPVEKQPTRSGSLKKGSALARWGRSLLLRLTGGDQSKDSKNANGDASTSSKKAFDIETLDAVANKPRPDANQESGNEKKEPSEVSKITGSKDSAPNFTYQSVYSPTAPPYLNTKLLESGGNDESTKKSTAESNITPGRNPAPSASTTKFQKKQGKNKPKIKQTVFAHRSPGKNWYWNEEENSFPMSLDPRSMKLCLSLHPNVGIWGGHGLTASRMSGELAFGV